MRLLVVFTGLAIAACATGNGPTGFGNATGEPDQGSGRDPDAPSPPQESPKDSGPSTTPDAGDAGATDGGGDGGPGPTTTDPFDSASCTGPVLDGARATALLLGNTRVTLATTSLQSRQRTCTAGVCGPWGAPSPAQRTYVVYSGGVTTRYKSFAFPTTLVLWGSATKALTVRHTPDVTQCPTCDTRGTRFLVGTTPITAVSNEFYLWDPTPSNPYDYQDLPIYFPGATLTLEAREHCARYLVDWPAEQMAGLYTF